ncbi:hypothetical protein [Streptomyces sp. NPDC046685]|uniref:hypothetical protein n=1 Tax=Streptomyces sp. NPDC046685 TaxID=3157202 RepID=UPI0033CC0732
MTFILLTCTPMLAAVLLLHWEPREPHRRRPRTSQPRRRTPRRNLIHCPLAPPALTLPAMA